MSGSGIRAQAAKIDVSKLKKGPIVATLIVGAFVAILNETLLNIALPDLMIQFDITESTVQWLVTAYMLVVGILVPITALLQQWFTTRQMFIGAMMLFLVGTVVSGTSSVFEVMLTGRIIQALGTGLMLPVMMNTILIIFPPENRGAAMGMIGLVIMAAPAIGPTLSGLIVDSLGWRWLFYLIIPLAVFAIVFAFAYLKNVSDLTKPKVDIISILLSSIGFGGIVYGFSRMGTPDSSWSDPIVIWCLAGGATALLLFIWRQFAVKEPILDLRSFKFPMFSLVVVLMLILMMAMFSTMIMLPIFLQNALGMTALAAGLVLMPGGIINGIMAPISGKLFDMFGPKVMVIPGLILMSLSIYLFMGIESTWTGGYVILLHVIMMVGISMVMMPAQTTGLNQLPKRLYAHGTAIMNTLQQVAGAIGMALFISIMTTGSQRYAERTGDPNPIEAMVAGLHDAFQIGLYLALGALVLSFFVKRVVSPKEDTAAVEETGE